LEEAEEDFSSTLAFVSLPINVKKKSNKQKLPDVLPTPVVVPTPLLVVEAPEGEVVESSPVVPVDKLVSPVVDNPVREVSPVDPVVPVVPVVAWVPVVPVVPVVPMN
jgi:hypothetical protein